ncbi:TPA: site-specific integrase [Bacillus cereus]|nr:site-specific integrase [Bacillus cereus]HDR4608702.1 site-specific integrase [Bacillus cereus]HDR4624540.1 site-specific integrase [Bacillus cereus]HDR4659252.1 site-specific integrase [Bacillus cereus]HDR4927155.1 site-specific integrase [Bacillus cereus]
MAKVKVLRDISPAQGVYEINGSEIKLYWSKKLYVDDPDFIPMECLEVLVDDVEYALKSTDIKLFKCVIRRSPLLANNILKIAEKVFYNEFSALLKEICKDFYFKEKVISKKGIIGFLIEEYVHTGNQHHIIKESVEEFYDQLKNDLKNALVDLRIKGVKRISNSFPDYMRRQLLYTDLKEVCSNYLIRIGRAYIDKNLCFNRKKFGVFALGISDINVLVMNNIDFRYFMQPIFQQLESYLIEKLKTHRYSFSDDSWLIVDMNIQIPMIRKLDWTFLHGIVKVELKEYIHNYIQMGENVRGTARRFRYIQMLGAALHKMQYNKYSSLLDVDVIKVQQIIDILQKIHSKTGMNYNIKTIQSCISECRLLFDWIVKKKEKSYIENPFRAMILHNVDAFSESATYIPEEVIKVLKEKLSELAPFVQYAWTIMMNTGIRINEVINLKEECLIYDAKDKIYYLKFIPYKTLKYRRKHSLEDYHYLPISDASLIKIINQQIEDTRELRKISGENRIFVKNTRKGIKLYSGAEIARAINKLIHKYSICNRDGLLWKYTHHQCRKTVAVNLFTNGATVEEVSDWLTHLDSKATMKHYHDIELMKIAKLDAEYFNIAFDNLDSDIKNIYSPSELKHLKDEIMMGSRNTPEGHGTCIKHVSFGPCHKKKCVGCKMLITGPQKLEMWKKLYSEQQSYLDEYEKVMIANNIDDWKDYREYQAEISLLKTYDDTVQKLEKFIKERLSEDEQKQYLYN